MSISVKNVTKVYGTQKALDDISFEVSSGEIVGFIGPNGAGKSTTMKIITGFLSDFTGSVSVGNLDVKENPLEVKKIIGYLPEHNPLYADMYVREYLQFVGRMFQIETDLEKAIDDVVEQIGLTKEQYKKISMLSKGYRQRVGLASVLIHNPQVLILDEPTTGLDPNQLVEIRDIIASIGKSKTILLSTHIMQEVEAICDRVIIINNGHIVANDDTESIKQNNEVSLTISVEFLQTCNEDLLKKIPEVESVVRVTDSHWLLCASQNEDIRQNIFNFAVENNLTIISLQMQEKSLEDVFRELTQKSTE